MTIAIVLYLSPKGVYPPENLTGRLLSLLPRTIAQQASTDNTWTVGGCQSFTQIAGSVLTNPI